MKKQESELEVQIVEFLNNISLAKVIKDNSDGVLSNLKEHWSILNELRDDKISSELLFLKSLVAYRYAHVLMHKKNDLNSLQIASGLFEFADEHLPCQSEFSQTKFFTKLYRIAILKRINHDKGTYTVELDDKISQIWIETVSLFTQYQSKFEMQGHFRNLNDLYFNMLEIVAYENGFDISKIEGMGICNDIQMFTSSKNSYQIIYSKPDFKFTNIQYSRNTAINIARSIPQAYIFEVSPRYNRWINLRDDSGVNEISLNNRNLLIHLMYNPEILKRPVGDRFRQALSRFTNHIKSDVDENLEIQNIDDVLSFANNSAKLIVGVVEKSILTNFSDRYFLANLFNNNNSSNS